MPHPQLNDKSVGIRKTEEGRDFEFELAFKRGSIFTTYVEAKGKLYQNDSDLTVITGSSTIIKVLNAFLLIFATPLTCVLFWDSQGFALLIFLSCLILILWFDIYRDRNKAIEFLQQVIDSAENEDKAKIS